jgi:adenylate cyclase
LSLVNGLRSRLVALLGTRYGVVALSLLLATLIWGGLDAVSAPWLRAMEDRAGDWLWSVSAKQTDERRVIVVDIDDRSLSEIGPWPWPRATQAKLMDVLAEAGVRQQIFDVVFSEPRPDDSVLLQSVQKHHPVLAQVFALEQGGTPSNGQPAGALDWATCPAPFSQAQGYIANQSLFAVSASAPLGFTGHITPRVATDGVVRHQPAIICWGDKSYPALSLAAMMQAAGETSLSLQRGSWFESPWQLSGGSQTVGKIPLDERGDMRVSWRLHPNSFISLSAADLLAGRTRNSLPADVLSGAWVLVGSSAFGIKDTIATPFGGANAGLLAHAQLLAALIDGRTPYTPRVAAIGQVFVVLLGIAFLFALSKERPADNANAPRAERRFPHPFAARRGAGLVPGLVARTRCTADLLCRMDRLGRPCALRFTGRYVHEHIDPCKEPH